MNTLDFQKILPPLKFYLLIFVMLIACEPENPKPEPENPEKEPEDIIEIPDDYFKQLLVSSPSIDTNADDKGDSDIDLNNDGEIQVSEAKEIEGLILSLDYTEINRIVDFTGINNFENLTYLKITAPSLVGLEPNTDSTRISYDFSGLKLLERLQVNDINSSYIENINLTGLTKLKSANLDGIKPQFFEGDYDIPFNFTEVKMNGCMALENLSLTNSWLYIDYCEVPSLKKLNLYYLEGGEPEMVDLHCLKNLEWLDISENRLDSLFLKNSSVLSYFRADDIGTGYYDTNDFSNYPFLKYICIDDIQQEMDQVSTLVGDETTLTTSCNL